MTDKDKVRSVVARFFNVPETAVSDDFVFPPERLQGSVGRATFRSAIKRMAGVDLASAAGSTTFRELFVDAVPSAVQSEATATAPVPQSPAATIGRSVPVGFGVGIDIENYDHLPAVSDPWSDSFYTDHFTAAEIAYCQRRPDPRESFCGLWCAKEAVIKSCKEFADRKPKELEVRWDGQGRPALMVVRQGQPEECQDCHISISHSHGVAVAVCLSGMNGVAIPKVEAGGGGSKLVDRPVNGWLVWVALGVGILSLLMSVAVLLKK